MIAATQVIEVAAKRPDQGRIGPRKDRLLHIHDVVEVEGVRQVLLGVGASGAWIERPPRLGFLRYVRRPERRLLVILVVPAVPMQARGHAEVGGHIVGPPRDHEQPACGCAVAVLARPLLVQVGIQELDLAVVAV